MAAISGIQNKKHMDISQASAIQKYILQEMDFVNTYNELSKKYTQSKGFKDYKNEEIQKVFSDLGYKPKFQRQGNFYSFIETPRNFKLTFNINLKYGGVELIWSGTYNEGLLAYGGPWGAISDKISGLDAPIHLPVFRTYDELREILAFVLKYYEEYKTKLLARITD